MNLLTTETETKEAIVVLYDFVKRCKTSVVEETTLSVCPHSFQRSRTVTLVWRTTGLEVVDMVLLDGSAQCDENGHHSKEDPYRDRGGTQARGRSNGAGIEALSPKRHPRKLARLTFAALIPRDR